MGQPAERSEGAPTIRILALDDDIAVLSALSRLLSPRGFDTTKFSDPESALEALGARRHEFDLMVCDVAMPRMNGLEVLVRAQQTAPEIPVVMLTGDNTAETAVKALQSGAFNYLTKPLRDPDAVAAILSRAASYGKLLRHARQLEEQVASSSRFEEIVGASAPIRAVFDTIERIARHDLSVVILGDSGTGKELVARAIHRRSSRSEGPFVALNCAALPESLVDSELFGHTRGAFTGAIADRVGAFERASGGTLFLDEIGDIPLSVQVRLLRVLQEREVLPVGSGTPKPVDVRVVAATLVDLEAAVDAKEFRPDLYYRLNVMSLPLPALRYRADDIPLLAAHFLNKHAERMGRSVPALSPGAIDALCAYHWPGTVRELENAIQRALALSLGEEISVAALPEPVTKRAASGESVIPIDPADVSWSEEMPIAEARKLVTENFERAYLTRLLAATKGNISETARRANVDRTNLKRILARLAIDVRDYR